ncbi:MAG: phosphatase PAP2 family protein [Deltaproteobacteria bacterium]|nr:phosphatase PAP2 family protein [Deltaproteobacteria bacterium]
MRNPRPGRRPHLAIIPTLTLCTLGTLCTHALPASAQLHPRWIGPVGADTLARDTLRAHDARTRSFADVSSWVIVGAVLAAPLAVSAHATAAQQAPASSFALSAISLAIPYGGVALTGFIAKSLFARERPYATAAGLARRCITGNEPGCDADRNASFPSLHSAFAFAGAGMTCVQAATLAPYAAGLDALGCGFATFGATLGAALRMVADKHYASDVIVGSLLGASLSVGLAVAFHQQSQAPLRLNAALETPQDTLGPTLLGAGLGILSGGLLMGLLGLELRAQAQAHAH